jgi:dCMP deaminase
MFKGNKWDNRFINLAKTVSSWSKDGTKVGAVIVRPDKTIASVGFNGLPPGMNDDDYFPLDRRDSSARVEKNLMVLHAEENAVLSCTDASMKDYSIFIYGLHPCAHCASVLARKGIGQVSSVGKFHPDWEASVKAAQKVFSQCGIYHRMEKLIDP